jgi:hypothetical protein
MKHDLLEVRRLLSAGDATALDHLQLATKDVSASFILPTAMIGRSAEHDEIIKVIDRVSHQHHSSQRRHLYGASPSTSLSGSHFAPSLDLAFAPGDLSSDGDNASSNPDRRNSANANDPTYVDSGHPIAPANGEVGAGQSKSSVEAGGSLTAQRTARHFRRQGTCEVISVSGAAGSGKSSLVQSVQFEARRRGYFVVSKFDGAKKTPFGPVLDLLSSLFKQVFSESDKVDPDFHQVLKEYLKPTWPLIHGVLGLPEFLLSPKNGPSSSTRLDHSPHHSHHHQQHSGKQGHEPRAQESPPANIHSNLYDKSLGAQSSQDFLRAGSFTKSNRLMSTFVHVLRIFTRYKVICLCLDDVHYADDESMELITQLASARMDMVVILTYRPEAAPPDKLKGILDRPTDDEPGLHCS